MQEDVNNDAPDREPSGDRSIGSCPHLIDNHWVRCSPQIPLSLTWQGNLPPRAHHTAQPSSICFEQGALVIFFYTIFLLWDGIHTANPDENDPDSREVPK